ncbi:MAG: hypothetical protein ACTSW1_11265 [Candidatus Hodarchaeales archaeon]
MAGTIIGVFSVFQKNTNILGYYDISPKTMSNQYIITCDGSVDKDLASLGIGRENSLRIEDGFQCLSPVDYIEFGLPAKEKQWTIRGGSYGCNLRVCQGIGPMEGKYYRDTSYYCNENVGCDCSLSQLGITGELVDVSQFSTWSCGDYCRCRLIHSNGFYPLLEKFNVVGWTLEVDGKIYNKENSELHISSDGKINVIPYDEGRWTDKASIELLISKDVENFCSKDFMGTIICKPTTTSTTTSTVTTAPADEVHILPIDETAGDYLPLLAVLGIVMVAGLIIWRR